VSTRKRRGDWAAYPMVRRAAVSDEAMAELVARAARARSLAAGTAKLARSQADEALALAKAVRSARQMRRRAAIKKGGAR
jgi:hypothetical protein